jgi:uncharacterized membrane protein YdfJ with MMPL/SSD domain
MLGKPGTAFYRARWIILVVSLFVIAGMAFYGFGLFNFLKSGGFTDPSSESSKAQVLLDTRLGGASPDVIVLMSSDTLKASDAGFASAARALLTTLQARPEVRSVSSYYSTQSAQFISRDGHETFAVVQLAAQDESTREQDFKTIQPLITSPTLHITTGGNVAVNVAMNKQVGADLERAETITFPIVALLLLIVFGGLVAASLPLVIGGVAILGAFAILHVIASITDVSIFAVNVVTILALGLAIDYSLFVITRFREELASNGGDTRGALERTMSTAGRTILFSGLTVSTSLLGLLLFPQVFLRSMGEGAIAATLVALLASLTLLPTLLALLGKRVNALSLQRLLRRGRATERERSANEASGFWYRLSETVMRRPIPVALAVLVILVTLGLPFLRVSFSTPDVKILPANQDARIVSERLSGDFAQQGNAQLVIVVATQGQVLSPANLAHLDSYVRSISQVPGVKSAESLVSVNPSLTLADYQQIYAHPAANLRFAALAGQLANGNLTKVVVALRPADQTAGAERIVRQVRAISTPSGMTALVDGVTPAKIDLLASLGANLPHALLIIAVAVFLLLFLMTGSLVVPLKAVLLNILSLSATFGGLVWIFQDGHLQNLLNFQSSGTIDATQPILIFAIAFGLSMDYEVFLLSRIKERFDELGDNRAAVSSGMQRTGRLITSAAMLLAVVVGAFASSKIIFIQEIGLGLAIAVIIDATLVRMLLVPATMRLLGRWNWWAPAPLQALWLRIGLSENANRNVQHATTDSPEKETVQV